MLQYKLTFANDQVVTESMIILTRTNNYFCIWHYARTSTSQSSITLINTQLNLLAPVKQHTPYSTKFVPSITISAILLEHQEHLQEPQQYTTSQKSHQQHVHNLIVLSQLQAQSQLQTPHVHNHSTWISLTKYIALPDWNNEWLDFHRILSWTFKCIRIISISINWTYINMIMIYYQSISIPIVYELSTI